MHLVKLIYSSWKTSVIGIFLMTFETAATKLCSILRVIAEAELWTLIMRNLTTRMNVLRSISTKSGLLFGSSLNDSFFIEIVLIFKSFKPEVSRETEKSLIKLVACLKVIFKKFIKLHLLVPTRWKLFFFFILVNVTLSKRRFVWLVFQLINVDRGVMHWRVAIVRIGILFKLRRQKL